MSGGKSPRIPLPKHCTKHVRPVCSMSFSSPSTQRSIREGRVETVRLISTEVQRRTELADQTLPALFVRATALDAKKR